MNPAHARPYRARSSLLLAALAALAALAIAGCAREETPVASTSDMPDAAQAQAVALDAPTDPFTQASSAPPRLARSDRNPAAAAPAEYHEIPKPPEPKAHKEMLKPYTNLGPQESRYFKAKYLTQDATKALLRKDFDTEAQALANEAGADGMARQSLYTEAFQAALARYKDQARLHILTCGRVACMGSIQASKLDFMRTVSRDIRAAGLPMPSMAWQPIGNAPQFDVRFMFTTQGNGGFHTRRPQ